MWYHYYVTNTQSTGRHRGNPDPKEPAPRERPLANPIDTDQTCPPCQGTQVGTQNGQPKYECRKCSRPM